MAEYAAAVDRIVALGGRELRIFDPDGRQLALDTASRIAALEAFLVRGPDQRILLAVHSTDHLTRDCARFIALLHRHVDRIAVHRTGSEAARAQDCFVLADAAHCVRRPVAAQPRGVVIIGDPREIALQRERFDQIWEQSTIGVPPSTLGL